jgi:hypothetical protein
MKPMTFATGAAVIVPACVGEYTMCSQSELELMRMSRVRPLAEIDHHLAWGDLCPRRVPSLCIIRTHE